MARLARIVIPGRAHHVTQRGNRREAIFFEEGDRAIYLDLLAEQAARYEVQVWAYCLVPNHVHLMLVSAQADRLDWRWARRTEASPTSSTLVGAGRGTCSRTASPRWCRTTITSFGR
jgi:REP element-mobilizing transposase RayT